ncbi:unnamed protein product, partial [Chrysoparadoxa australica]
RISYRQTRREEGKGEGETSEKETLPRSPGRMRLHLALALGLSLGAPALTVDPDADARESRRLQSSSFVSECIAQGLVFQPNSFSSDTVIPLTSGSTSISALDAASRTCEFVSMAQVGVILQHESLGTLDISVKGPNGGNAKLSEFLGGNRNADGEIVFSDELGLLRLPGEFPIDATIPDGTVFQSQQSLIRQFVGLDLRSSPTVFTLEIINDDSIPNLAADGTLLGWNLDLCCLQDSSRETDELSTLYILNYILTGMGFFLFGAALSMEQNILG